MIYSLTIETNLDPRDSLDWHEIQISHHDLHSCRLSFHKPHDISE